MESLKNKHPKILVIGDLMIDHYLWGSCERISPEAPVQVLNVKNENLILGGAGNVISNLKTLGAKVDVISVLSEDLDAKNLKQMLISLGSNLHIIYEKDRKTTKKSRLIASNQQIIRYDNETIKNISKDSQNKIITILKEKIKEFDVILLSDYGKGVLTKKLTKKIIEIANFENKKVLVDPKGDDYSKYKGAYLLTPNKKEASLATNIKIEDKKSLKKAIKKIKKDYKLSVSLITLSEDGIAFFTDELKVIPTVAKEVYDVTGAGDTVLASIGFALSCNLNIKEAISFANFAAGIVVSKLGSATANLDEITAYKSSLNISKSTNHIKTFKEIEKLTTLLRNKNKKIVFTNGCFDILHVGHVKYLEKAKNLGDVLILGLNSDESVKRLKGKQRPINNQEDRAYTLAALESVDYVVIFQEDTPYNLIKTIKPDILVKGADYKNKKIVGSDLVDEVKLIEFVENKSTTKIIQRIKNSEASN